MDGACQPADDLLPICAAIWSAWNRMAARRPRCCRSTSRRSMRICRSGGLAAWSSCMKRSRAARPVNMPVSRRYSSPAFSRACRGRCCGVCAAAISLRPRLRASALHPDRVIFCETWKDRDVLPAMEEGLKCGGLAGGGRRSLAFVAERVAPPATCAPAKAASRRSSFAAGTTRRKRSQAGEPNAAATRWRISPHPSPAERLRWVAAPALASWICCASRGGEPHSWILEACDATGHLALPAALAERSAAAGEAKTRRHGINRS